MSRFPFKLRMLGFILSVLSISGCLKHTSLSPETLNYPNPFIHPGHSESVTSVAFSSDGKFAISGGKDQTIRLWDTEKGRQIRVFEGHGDIVTSVPFSPNSKIAISGSHDHTLRLWQISTGKEIGVLKGHKSFVTSVSFSPDGKSAIPGRLGHFMDI